MREIEISFHPLYIWTKEQRNKLKELGCDAFQGYLNSKPLEFDELIRWLEQHK